MIALSVNKLSKSYGGNTVFHGLSMDVQDGERVGLIGPNGCGKTTMMKILMAHERADEGTVAYRKGVTVGYLKQLPDYPEAMSVSSVMTLAFDDLNEMKGQMSDYEEKLTTLEGEALDRAVKQYGELSHRFEEQGGYDMDTRMNIIAEGLGIPFEMREQSFGKLSGGEKTRVELAKTLLEEPDILLLDEPSNHLDMTSIEWLEDFLKSYHGTVIIVSHDRYFLDRVVGRIIEMSYDSLTVYHGNYSYYVLEKERRFLIDMKFYENQQKKIARMEEQIKRYRVWGAMRDSDKMYRKAKELEKRLEKIDKMDRPKFENSKVKLTFDSANRTGKRVLEVKGLSKSFYDKTLFAEADLALYYTDSLCLMGDNGTGKSTLLKMMVQEAIDQESVWINHEDFHDASPMDGGTIHFGSRIKVGYLAQEVAFEKEDQSILTYFSGLHNLPDSAARKELAKVLFVKDDVNKQIGTLSGGEKSRLKLCSLMYDQVNLMILDEPTNHLDIDSREILEETLLTYDGTILFVSHDRYFIAKIANRVAEIENRQLHLYNGGYDYFREEKAKSHRVVVRPSDEKVKTEKVKDSKKISQKFRIEYEKLGEKITALEQEQETLAKDMEDSASDGAKLSELYEKNEALEVTLLDCYERWEELTEMFEGAK